MAQHVLGRGGDGGRAFSDSMGGTGGAGQGSEGGGVPKMAASMCDVFSFCVGVAGGARGSVEVRFVSSAKVRRGCILPGETPRGPVPTAWSPPARRRPGSCSGPGRRVCPGCRARGGFARTEPSLGACLRILPENAAAGDWSRGSGSPGVGALSCTRLGRSWLGLGLSYWPGGRGWVGGECLAQGTEV